MLRAYEQTEGRSEFRIALIDGAVFSEHPSLRGSHIRSFNDSGKANPTSLAVIHATFIASILVGRGAGVIGLCPRCVLLSVPAVDDDVLKGKLPALGVAHLLVKAVKTALAEGADVIQLSLDFPTATRGCFQILSEALEGAGAGGVSSVIATGNGGRLESNFLLGAKGVIPVAMADACGFPHPDGNLGPAAGRRGILAPGTRIPGAVPPDGFATFSGTSYAAAMVTGAIALLDSLRQQTERENLQRVALPQFDRRASMRTFVPQHLDLEASLST